MELNSIEEIIEDIRQGKMVVIMDDEDRENEGDLLMAASLVRPQDINFMATHGRGLICLTLTPERCRQLSLPLMVYDNQAQLGTAFTVSIEAAEGVTTGISAHDRAHTVLTAVEPDAKPQDLVQPGHIFPLMAQPGGVLTRAGHTEAGCDLARLAGLEPAAVIVEILNQDGSMARRADLEQFAQRHDLKIGTIADLIQYRIKNEKTVEQVTSCTLATQHGDFQLFAYQDDVGFEDPTTRAARDLIVVQAREYRVGRDDFVAAHTGRLADMSVDFDDVSGSCLLVQGVDVLGDDRCFRPQHSQAGSLHRPG